MAETVKIIVPHDVVTIEVNEKGDTIVLPVSDERFTKRLIDFSDRIEKESVKIKDATDAEDILATVNADIEFHETLKTEFDNLFGEDAYEKVYGSDILVGAEYVLEFIEQCLPYIQKHTMKRMEKLNKYNANRVGSAL